MYNLYLLKPLLYPAQILIGSNIFPIRNTLRSKRTRLALRPPVIIATHSNLVKRPSNIVTTCPVSKLCMRIVVSRIVPPPFSQSLGRTRLESRKCWPPIGGRAIKLG